MCPCGEIGPSMLRGKKATSRVPLRRSCSIFERKRSFEFGYYLWQVFVAHVLELMRVCAKGRELLSHQQ